MKPTSKRSSKRSAKPEPADPLTRSVTDALIEWLESAILGALCEDMEVVPDCDRGEPADPFIAVYVKIAPGEENSHTPRRVEIVIAIEAENSRFLPDDADEILKDLHMRIAMPLNPSSDPDDDEGNAPYGDLLEGLRAAKDFRLLSLHDARHPTLMKPPTGFDHLVYVGVIQEAEPLLKAAR